MTKKDFLIESLNDADPNDVVIPINTRVRVISQGTYKYKNPIGKLGTVRYTVSSWGKIAVELDDDLNTRSSLGVFYFKPDEIEIISNNNMEENVMIVNAKPVTNYLNSVKIRFMDNNTLANYIYANFDPDIKVDDLVVVQPAHHPITLARVVEVIDRNDYETTREVVAKVDTSAYSDRMKTRQLAAELKAKMEERAKKLQDVALYKMLAENDPEMMDLLNRYQSLPTV